MMTLQISVILVAVLAVCSARTSLNVTSDTRLPRLNLPYWCSYDFTESHNGWSGNQPENLWSKIKVYIPINASSVQITAVPPSGNWSDNPYGRSSYVPEVDIFYDNQYPATFQEKSVLYVYIFYWSSPWTIYFGFDKYAGSCYISLF